MACGIIAGVNSPNPALVSRGGARRLPRLALLLFCAAYVLPGVFGRDPWRNADITAFGYMLSIAEGRSPWLAPALGGVALEGSLLPHWLGASFIKLLAPLVAPDLAARLPFAMLLGLVLALTWYSTFHLARTSAAQPLAFAFGGEAEPVDYARTMADAAVLALMACLGLLQLGHETTPELAQLFGVALFMWSLAAAPHRVAAARLASLAALVVLAGSGAPTMALATGLAGAAVTALSRYEQVRGHTAWVLLALLLAAATGWATQAWAWKLTFEASGTQFIQLVRLWAWFLWPAWPLAAWTLWRWRRQLTHRHIAVPLAGVAVALLACVWMGGSDRALLLGLPGLAVLAAFALPTLKRSTAAAIDWFSMFFFTLAAITTWVIYASLHTGVPAKPAANVARLAVGYEPLFSAAALALAALATLAWLWLLRWRTGRSPQALWKSLVLPAGGVALWWLLLMTLGLPLLDYARSSRPWAQRVARHIDANACVAAKGLSPAQVAALEYFGKHRVDARRDPLASGCAHFVAVNRQGLVPALPGWALQAQEQRPTDRQELTLIYRRR